MVLELKHGQAFVVLAKRSDGLHDLLNIVERAGTTEETYAVARRLADGWLSTAFVTEHIFVAMGSASRCDLSGHKGFPGAVPV